MKVVFAILICAATAFSSAQAQYVSGFYQWVEATVVRDYFTHGAETDIRTMHIVVAQSWADTPHQEIYRYRFWLPMYIMCTKHAELVSDMEDAREWPRYYVSIEAQDGSKLSARGAVDSPLVVSWNSCRDRLWYMSRQLPLAR